MSDYVCTVVCLPSTGEWDWGVRIATWDRQPSAVLIATSSCVILNGVFSGFFSNRSLRPLHVWCSSSCAANQSCTHLASALTAKLASLQLIPRWSPQSSMLRCYSRSHSSSRWRAMIGRKRKAFLCPAVHTQNTSHSRVCVCVCVCEQSDTVALAIAITNCLPCNQPPFACCSHQNSFECSVAMAPWKICCCDFFFFFLLFLSWDGKSHVSVCLPHTQTHFGSIWGKD